MDEAVPSIPPHCVARLKVIRDHLTKSQTAAKACPYVHPVSNTVSKVESPMRLFGYKSDRDIWVISDHQQVKQVLCNEKEISANRGLLDDLIVQHPALKKAFTSHTLFIDGAEHDELRNFIVPFLEFKKAKGYEDLIRKTAKKLLDGAVSDGAHTFDYVKKVAHVLPCIVVAAILGFPEEDVPQLKEWSEKLGTFLGEMTRSDKALEDFLAIIDPFSGYVENLAEKKRKSPDNTLISGLVQQQELHGWSTDKLVTNIIAVIFGGHETTTNLIGTTLALLLKHPDQLEMLRKDPSLASDAVEEAMRIKGPLHNVARTVKEDIEIAGKLLKKGDFVVLNYHKANLDPDYVENGATFDITRTVTKPHVGFGFGIHYCPGRHLGRLETSITIQETLAKFPHIELESQQLKWLNLSSVFSLETLPIKVSL